MGVDYIPTGVATGVSGAIFGAQVVTPILAASNFVPAAGCYIAYALGADVRMQVQDSTGTWQNVTAVGVGIPFFNTDGTNVRFNNAGGGSENITLIKIG